jgi:hypothetical protein
MSVMATAPLASANVSDYFVYSQLDTGVLGSYGVDGYVGADGVDRIIFYSPGWESATAYIYTVTIPEGADPNMHPDNPEAPGPIAPRTFTLEKTFDLGVNPGHESEFYVDAENNIIYLGASVGIRKYVYDDMLGNYVFDSTVAPPAPMEEGYYTQSLAYDPASNTWYAGSIAWNYEPGITLRDIWKYDGSQGNAGTWDLSFQYTTPEGIDPMTHHDGMEFVVGYLFLADYVGDYITKYSTDGTQIDIFWHKPLEHELEGMGFGALTHFWCGSHGSTISEFGGGRLQITEVDIDIKPGSFPNSINLRNKGNVPVAILSSLTFDATTVDRSTVVFAGASPLPIGQTPEDVNGDGLLDVVLHFSTQSLNLQLSDTEACLTGKTLGGQDFKGCDSVRIVK